MFKGKSVLVTGSEGMIGKELVLQLKELVGYDGKIHRIDLKDGIDITNKTKVRSLFDMYDVDYVFHLAGIKGSPKMTKERPADFMGPMLQFDTNMILASQKAGVKRFLYTSSIAVEHPESDKYPAWAKMTAETLIEAMRIQYPKGTEYCIVRPSNVYGRFDNFDTEYPMVVTNLIKSAMKYGEVRLYNDGQDIRDFINAKDVALGMIQAMEQMPDKPVNLCSGEGNTIKYLADLIADKLGWKVITGPETKPTVRVMECNWDFKSEISLEEGIKEVIDYVKANNN